MRGRAALDLFGVMSLGVLVSGCMATRYQTETPRSATEQLLLSEAIERAVDQLEWPEVDGRAVTLEVVALNSADAAYLGAAAEARLAERGARLAGPEDADLVLVLRAGSLGTVSRRASFGIPEFTLPGGLGTPSIPFIGALKQRGYAKLRLAAFDASGARRATVGPVLGRAYFDLYSFFLLVLRRNEIYPGEELSLGVD